MSRVHIAAFALFAFLTAAPLAAAGLGDLDGIVLPPPASPSSAVQQVNDGASLLAAGKSLEAEELLTKAVAVASGSAEGYYNLGLALAFNGKHGDALEAQTKALALRADFPEAHLALGIAHLTLGQPEQAIEAFDAVLARTPESPTGRAALFDKGTALGRLKRYVEAEICLAEALAADPDDPSPAFQIGKLKMEQEKWKDALGWFETTAAAFPLESHILSGRAHIALGDRAAAEASIGLAASSLSGSTPDDATRSKLSEEIDRLRTEAARIGNK